MVDYETEPTEASVISKINSGMLINLRLNELWKDAHRHSRDGKYSKWNDDLDRVWMELGGDEKEVDQKKDKKKYEESSDYKFTTFSKEYAEACGSKTKTGGFNKINDADKGSFVKQKQALMKKELFLRRLQNQQGKGTAYQTSDEDYMD